LYKALHVTLVAASDAEGLCLLYLLLVVKPLEDDVGICWPYTSAFKGLKNEFFGDRGAPGCPEQREKVAFLERYKALGAVKVMHEPVGIL
jgi:hypothetical protein